MLKRFLFVAALAGLAIPAFPQANPRGEAQATVAGKSVSIEYGRPSLKGRDMLAQAKAGQSWRMGSDAATSLTTEADLDFGGVSVPKGTYILTATKGEAGAWLMNVLAKEDREKVADVSLTPTKTEKAAETFTIHLKGEGNEGRVKLLWGNTALKAKFTAK